MKRYYIIRRNLTVFFCVAVVFAFFAACSDNGTELQTITDIYATDVETVYDGNPHSITVQNILESDIVLYSIDNEKFISLSPAFTDPGSYTVYYKVIRSGYKDFTSSAEIVIHNYVLDGISASNVTVIYDGLPHSVSVSGILPSDAVTYSVDGISFSVSAPSFTEVGVYTVYYGVERGFGKFASSCTLFILPDCSGRYFNKNVGLIAIDGLDAYLNGEETEFSLEADGTGFIGVVPISVSSGTLTYGTQDFTLISDEDCVYRLNSSSLSIYFYAQQEGVLTVSFDEDSAIIKLGDTPLLAVSGANYCESGDITDYVELTFEQTFSRSLEITDVEVTLSRRESNPFVPDDIHVVYDGLVHTFDFSEPFIYLDGEVHEYTEVGSYAVTAVFLSDEYLPLVAVIKLVILPDLDGLYFSSEKIIKITEEDVYIDGELCGRLQVADGGYTFDGSPIIVTDGGIFYDGNEYSIVNSVLIFRANGAVLGRAVLEQNEEMITVIFVGDTVSIACGDEVLISAEFSPVLELWYGGRALQPIISGTITVFVLGNSELTEDVVILDAVSK